MHLDSIEFIQKQKERAEIEMAKMAQADGRTKLFMSIPGIGSVVPIVTSDRRPGILLLLLLLPEA